MKKEYKAPFTLRIFAGAVKVNGRVVNDRAPVVETDTVQPGDGSSSALQIEKAKVVTITKIAGKPPSVVTSHPMGGGLEGKPRNAGTKSKKSVLTVSTKRKGRKPSQTGVYGAKIDMAR